MKPAATRDTITLHVPFRLVKRGGRKEVQLPDGAPVQRRTDNTLVKALARAFRWKRMLESDQFATINELAEHEGIAAPFLTRTMRLAHLAPEIVEAILDGRQPRVLTLEQMRKPLPLDWAEQKDLLLQSDHQARRPGKQGIHGSNRKC
ncbi:hypothetical protein EDC22_10243 [Tepidamorphus gemmatus]|uniref:LacI family transcriptional regulator n=1 Tax=Tepidamorphus gemmatus TaxID=747076 RepID=A0A4R3MFM0_9HYPH|nr:hypothetical protein [Tepidamorphus gemmatus]TCT12361.1 hypothetical protein EDC22_10243 [Tepidamorphus gemmatus]